MIDRSNPDKTAVSRKLMAWYDQKKRSLPWRETADPYRIWISEIMLQQTQVDTVIPYYRRFLEAFPTVGALADAPLSAVLKIWENLGYYSRARNLHAAARMVIDRFSGRLPDTREDLEALPGIGTYTAGAILSIAFGRAVPAVDGNCRRILSRLFALEGSLEQPRTLQQLHQLAASLVPRRSPGHFNQALMDLGASVCLARRPVCPLCPLGNLCRAKALGLQDTLPAAKKRPPLPHRTEAAALIHDGEGRLLAVQRPSTGLLASLWRLPGGFIEGKGTGAMKNRLAQRVEEGLGIKICVGRHLVSVDHAYTHFRTTLHAFQARIVEGAPRAGACEHWRWASPETLQALPFSKIDRKILQAALTINMT